MSINASYVTDENKNRWKKEPLGYQSDQASTYHMINLVGPN